MSDYDLDIIEERDGFRVRLEYDDSPEQPYDDGATPIFTIEPSNYGQRVEAFNRQAEPYVNIVSEVVSRFGLEGLERFARIFYGAVNFDDWYSDGIRGHYVAFDTEEWRADMGITDTERLKAENYLSEVRAWAEGDVYGYIVEREVSFEKKYFNAEGEDLEDLEDSGTEWVEVEDGSCWGHYGREWAEQAAREALAGVIGSSDS